MVKDDSSSYCENKKVLTGYDNLKITHLDIAKEWGIENYPCNGSPERYTLIKTKIFGGFAVYVVSHIKCQLTTGLSSPSVITKLAKNAKKSSKITLSVSN